MNTVRLDDEIVPFRPGPARIHLRSSSEMPPQPPLAAPNRAVYIVPSGSAALPTCMASKLLKETNGTLPWPEEGHVTNYCVTMLFAATPANLGLRPCSQNTEAALGPRPVRGGGLVLFCLPLGGGSLEWPRLPLRFFCACPTSINTAHRKRRLRSWRHVLPFNTCRTAWQKGTAYGRKNVMEMWPLSSSAPAFRTGRPVDERMPEI